MNIAWVPTSSTDSVKNIQGPYIKMCSECTHEIIILNLKSGETISHPVIIIKGFIKNETSSENAIHFDSNSFKLVDGKFKVLAELTPGPNTITLKYCHSTVAIILNYEPRNTDYTVCPLYIICKGHDGTFQAPSTDANSVESACKRIFLATKLLQSAIAEKLFEENFGRRTFRLEEACTVFYSDLDYSDARKMAQDNLWTRLGREIVQSHLGYEKKKFLAFLSCTKYCGEKYHDNFTHDEIVGITEAYVALGGGGLALFGTACLYTWPENLCQVIDKFQNVTPVDRTKFMDDSCYRGTLGGCYSTTLGSVLHELCHTFDLGHTEKGIMGRGFDDIYKVFLCNKAARPSPKVPSIVFEEKLNSGPLTKKMFKSRTMECLEKEHDNTFFTKSCTILLAYHKWFNNFDGDNTVIKFDSITKFVSSTAGLRVIELRDKEDGMVLQNWTFEGKILKYSFQLPDLTKLPEDTVLLLVENNRGHILKDVIKTK